MCKWLRLLDEDPGHPGRGHHQGHQQGHQGRHGQPAGGAAGGAKDEFYFLKARAPPSPPLPPGGLPHPASPACTLDYAV